jgi:hypothetical protein
MNLIYFATGSIIFIIFSISIYSYVKYKYKKYDEIETLKEKIIDERVKIKQAIDYFKNTYEHHVFVSIKTNVDLCLEIILNKTHENQIIYLKKLFDKLFETGYRLKTNYDDPMYIIMPLKNFREELAQELIDYIKDVERG